MRLACIPLVFCQSKQSVADTQKFTCLVCHSEKDSRISKPLSVNAFLDNDVRSPNQGGVIAALYQAGRITRIASL
jgi:hypothetical protein